MRKYLICLRFRNFTKEKSMNGKISILTICFFLTCFIHSALGTNYYVLYNQSCMDRLLYVASTKDTATEYLVYRLNANVNEKFYLEVGKESTQVQEFLPTQIYNCGNTLFDAKLVQSVNNGTDRVYLVVRKDNNRYAISQVIQIDYYLQVGQQVQYQSPRYAFNIDLQRGIIGENIATAPRTEMYFEGKLENECNGAYLFTHRMPGEAKPYSDLVFVPQVGMTELRRGVDPVDAWNNALRLEKINNYTLSEYLQVLCGNTPATNTNPNLTIKTPETATSPQLTERGVPQQYDQPTNQVGVSQNLLNRSPVKTTTTPATTTNPCGIASGNGYHVVQKGETLYRISKLYNITVSQIQTWNKLGSATTIHTCDRLAVAPPNSTAQTQVTPTQQGQIQQQPPLVIDNRPAVTTPAPYDTYVAPRGVTSYDQQQRINNTEAAWKTTQSDYHVVAPGETVASIALKYGFTEARFRDINNLQPNEMVRIGQPLLISDCPKTTPLNNTATQPQSYDNNTRSSQEFTAKSPYDFSDNQRINPQFYLPNEYSTTQGNVSGGGASVSPELSKRAAPTYYDSTVPQGYDSQPRGVQVQRQVHLVKEGESLYRIAQLYGITVERLRQLNNLGPNDVIIPYQRLYVN